ncbi:hypothetical protein NDU88_006012 [Pleurodeles waltl]|uniref:Uncharacterized protein n=1 Tax=Pleurodeles waltl TaxID=8319 RepID=A0AAV7NP09_PLEWA|nr:hypothetical protein NDU88_006012 [Pleurodeles waltl]
MQTAGKRCSRTVQNYAIEVFGRDVINQLKKIRSGTGNIEFDYLSPSQRLALDKLAKDPYIVIRESDKGVYTVGRHILLRAACPRPFDEERLERRIEGSRRVSGSRVGLKQLTKKY